MYRVPLKITIVYCFMSLVSIIVADFFGSLTGDNFQLRGGRHDLIQYAFLAITALLIFYLVKKENDKRNQIENNLFEIVNIIKSSQEAIIGINFNGEITSWNPAAEKIFGYSCIDAIGMPIYLVFSDTKKYMIIEMLNKAEKGELVDSFQLLMVNKDKVEIDVSITISAITNGENNIIGTSLIATDMTKQNEDERKLQLSYQELSAVYEQLAATEEELRAQFEELQDNQKVIRKSEERYKLALEGANDMIWEWNISTDKFTTSDKWCDLTGYDSPRLDSFQNTMIPIIHAEDRDRMLGEVQFYMDGKAPYYESEYRIITKAGKIKWVSSRGKLLRDESGQGYLMAGSMTNITDRKNRDEQIREMAYYDSVTGLPNRVMFTERLNIELNKSKTENTRGMVLFLDIDDFKKVNDTLGHDYGDELLRSIGKVLEECVGDRGVIGRFGGDEFLILVPEINGYADSMDMIKSVLDKFKTAFQIREKQFYATSSIGIAIYPDDGDTVQAIIKNVDTAMYVSKGNGKNTYYFFDKDISDAVLRRTEIEKGLRDALKNEELSIHYQPQIDIHTGKVHGLEALIRWNSRELGFVSPIEFIPVAEETGIINEIGEWIIRMSCRENKRLKAKGYTFNTISVNVSAIQLQQENFISMVKSILIDEEADPSFLEIEITESILMKSLEDNVKQLNDLRGLGIKTALDDFGTGYSSLRYLRMLPINTLKIDKSFIDEICFNESDKDITDGIIQLAHKINLDVVIEGVEDVEQVSLLKDMGCNLIQGYYFSKPLPVDKLEDLLKQGNLKV